MTYLMTTYDVNARRSPFWVAKGGMMVKSCCAVGCANRVTKGSKVSFYRFPVDLELRRQWIAAVDRKDWQPTEHSRICSAHFVSGRRSKDPLSPDYVPTIFPLLKSPVKRKRKNEFEAYKRRKLARRRRLEAVSREEAARKEAAREEAARKEAAREEAAREEAATSLMELNEVHDVSGMNVECDVATQTESALTCEVLVQTDLSVPLTSVVEEYPYDLSYEEISGLTKMYELTEDSLMSSKSKVKFYTGLPSYSVLKAVFNFVSLHMPPPYRDSTLPKFQQFLMFLLKLRLNLFDQDLAYRFGVSQSTVSRNFRKWVDVCYVRLKPLIKWPEKKELMETLPQDFKQDFPKCVCIIDAFEVFCERPQDLMARAQTYSNYKHHNTVKFLISITPQGVVSFVSRGWGGRVSDKHLTENCGLLENLLPGDQILADRGFNVMDAVGLYCAEIKIPPFTKGKKQLSKLEIDKARQLSRVRIHVERVIGVLRQKYTILESTLPISMIRCNSDSNASIIDKIVVVCCALCNCCESVVISQYENYVDDE